MSSYLTDSLAAPRRIFIISKIVNGIRHKLVQTMKWCNDHCSIENRERNAGT